MGLLDFNMPDMNTPAGQGLMAAAFSLMQAQRPTGSHGGLAGALGAAGQQYMGVSNQAQDQMARRKMLDLQMKSQQAELEQKQREQAMADQIRTAAMGSYRSPETANAMSMGPTPDGGSVTPVSSGFDQKAFLSKLYGIDPLKAMSVEASMAKDTPINKLDVKDFTPQSVAKFAMTKNYGDLVRMDKLTFQNTGGAIAGLDPFTGQQVSTTDMTGNPFNDLVLKRPDGTYLPNSPLVAAKKEIAKSGASNVNNTVSVAGPENAYNRVVGEGLGKTGLDTVEIAKSAPEVIRNARLVRQALAAGAITGTGAEARLAVQKALETVGLVGPGKAADTQALIAGLGKITLAGVKTSGLGAGNGFTDKDRAFLAEAISGTIESTPANLRRVADLSERVATANHQKGAAVLDRWRGDPALRNVAQDTILDPVPADAPASNLLPKLPPAPANKGRKIRDTETGKVLQSNGMTWVEVK